MRLEIARVNTQTGKSINLSELERFGFVRTPKSLETEYIITTKTASNIKILKNRRLSILAVNRFDEVFHILFRITMAGYVREEQENE